MVDSPGDLLALVEHDDHGRAVPTPDHFIPLPYLAGLAAATATTLEILVDGFAYGSLSMTCFTLGASCPDSSRTGLGDARVPQPTLVRPEQTST